MKLQIDINPAFRCMICNRQSFDYLELVDLIECTFCMECYSPAQARRIPYDEMRRLCGLDPAVKAYCAKRDMQKSFSQLGKAMNQMASDLVKGFERFTDALIASKPKHTTPMWVVDPGHSRRTTNRATDIRTPYR